MEIFQPHPCRACGCSTFLLAFLHIRILRCFRVRDRLCLLLLRETCSILRFWPYTNEPSSSRSTQRFALPQEPAVDRSLRLPASPPFNAACRLLSRESRALQIECTCSFQEENEWLRLPLSQRRASMPKCPHRRGVNKEAQKGIRRH